MVDHDKERALQLLGKLGQHYSSLISQSIPTRPLTHAALVSVAQRSRLYNDWQDGESAALNSDLGYLHFIAALTKTPQGIYRRTGLTSVFLHPE